MSIIPSQVSRGLKDFLTHKFDSDFAVDDFTPISGGCINNGGKLSTTHGIFFLKWNSAKRYPGMFDAEAKGLKLLASADVIRIPKVIGAEKCEGYQFIVMEFIESRNRSINYWKALGEELSALHRDTDSHFGLDHNNYMGSLHQVNEVKDSWIEFFITQRLNVQLRIAIDSLIIEAPLLKKFETLYKKFPSLLLEERPSLLHGDLWSGNLITDDHGNPCLIDPAVYYGNREVDLAMTQLFGGFAGEFYESYQNAFPLAPGFQERFDIYNLYPLLVHVNLFGQSYLHQVLSIIKSFE